MTHEITQIQPSPTVRLAPTVVVYSGRVVVGTGSTVMVRKNAAAEPFAFFVPESAPLSPGEAEPSLCVEASLMFVHPVAASNQSFPAGLERVTAAFRPDPRGGEHRWLSLEGDLHAARGIVFGYRVTAVSA